MSEPAIPNPKPAPSPWRRPGALFALVLLATAAFQIYYVFTCPLDLAGDVAHVWTWSQRLDIAYYSKPPMVAYLARLATWIGGDRPEAIRLMAVLLGLGTIWITYALARRMFDAWVGLMAVGAMAAAPVFSAGSILLTTDAPMFLCWGLTTWFVYLALFEEKGWAWYAAGLALLAGVLSKLTMLIFIPSLAIYLLIWGGGQRRRTARSAAPWIALAMGALGLVPVIVWNAVRGWPTLGHMLANNAGVGKPWAGLPGLALFIGNNLGILNPMLFVAYVAGMVGSIRRGAGRADRRYWLLACLSLPMMLFYLLLSIKKAPEANWPVAAYFTGLIATAAVFVERIRLERARRGRAVRAFCIATLALGLAAMLLFRYSQHLLYPPVAWANEHWGWNADARFDPTSRLMGYRELAAKVESLRAAWGEDAARQGRGFFLFSDDRQLAGELEFYLPGHPFVYRGYNNDHNEPGGREEDDQYRFWPQPEDDPSLRGADAMYVTQSDRVTDFVHCFDGGVDSIGDLGERPPYYELRIERGGLLVRTFYIRRFRRYNGAALQFEPGLRDEPPSREAAP